MESFVDFDNDVQSSNGAMTKEEILKETRFPIFGMFNDDL